MSRGTPSSPRSAADAEDTDLLAWRRRRTRRRILLRAGVPLLALVLIAAGIWVVGFSSALVIRSVEVTGNDELTEDQVLQVAAVPMGAALARVDGQAIEERIRTLKQVESAEVHRQWPSTLAVTVSERTPLYAVPTAGGGAVLVDRHGVGYLQVPENKPKQNGKTLPRAEVDVGSERLLQAVATVVSSLPPKLQQKVNHIQATDADAIELKLKNGDTVFWGSADQSELKSEVIVALLEQPGSRYDVSAPGQPAVR